MFYQIFNKYFARLVLLNLCVVGAFLEELGSGDGLIDDGGIIDGRLCVVVWLEGANTLPRFLVVHAPHSQVSIITRRCQHGSSNIPSDTPDSAEVIIELSWWDDFEAIVSRLIDDWLKIENADIFWSNSEDVVASTRVGSERQIVNWFIDVDGFCFRPFTIVLAVFEDENFRLVWGSVGSGSDHRGVKTKERWVPADARKGNFAEDLVLEGPLREIENVGRFVDSDDTVGRRCRGQHQSKRFRAKLDVRHRWSWIDQIRSANPSLGGWTCGSLLLADSFFPNWSGAIETCACQNLAELRVSPI